MLADARNNALPCAVLADFKQKHAGTFHLQLLEQEPHRAALTWVSGRQGIILRGSNSVGAMLVGLEGPADAHDVLFSLVT